MHLLGRRTYLREVTSSKCNFGGTFLDEIPCQLSVVELPLEANVEVTPYLASTAWFVAGDQVSEGASRDSEEGYGYAEGNTSF